MSDDHSKADHSKTDHTKADSSGTLTAQLYDRLRRDVIMGTVEPGAKLKLEGLSKSYEVSVNTMRETLSRLASDGLVVAEGQRGFTVPPVSIEDLRDITQMRQLLECHALRQSIARADLEWEAQIVGCYHKLSRVEAVVEDDPDRWGADWERYNEEFHTALIANCGSRWLLLFRQAMYEQSQRYRMLSLKTRPFPRAQSANEHKLILDAALARDADRAVSLLEAHILKGAQTVAVNETVTKRS